MNGRTDQLDMDPEPVRFPHLPVEPALPITDGELILGREAGVHADYGRRGLLEVGRLAEEFADLGLGQGAPVLVEGVSPSVVAVLGTRGGGKSNTVGVLAEELADNGTSQAVVIVDPLGAFVGMCEPGEGPDSRGMNAAIFRVGHAAGDAAATRPFKIPLHTLTVDDLAFALSGGTDQQQALLGAALAELARGYAVAGGGRTMPGKKFFTLADLGQWVRYSQRANSAVDGYSLPTRQSILRRIADAERSGLFANHPREAVTAEMLCHPQHISVINLSDPAVPEPLKAMVVAWLARLILRSRLEAVNRGGADAIPNTFLLVDESQMYVPNGLTSAASADLVAYAKCGRKAGCGLVLATQQPAATNEAILSQADMLICHRLIFDRDIRTLMRIAPAHLPPEMLGDNFSIIRRLPAGRAIVADKLMQRRPVLVDIRPRHSRHTGTTSLAPLLDAIAAPGATCIQAAGEVVPSSPTDRQSNLITSTKETTMKDAIDSANVPGEGVDRCSWPSQEAAPAQPVRCRPIFGMAAVVLFVLFLCLGFALTGVVRSSGLPKILRSSQPAPQVAGPVSDAKAADRNAYARAQATGAAATGVPEQPAAAAAEPRQVASRSPDRHAAAGGSSGAEPRPSQDRAPSPGPKPGDDGWREAIARTNAVDWEEEHNAQVERQMRIVDDLMGGRNRRNRR